MSTRTDTAGDLPTLSTADEHRLLAALRDGETGAFAELLSRYRAPVYSYLSRCGVAAGHRERLFAEIFLRIRREIGNHPDNLGLSSWLFTIVTAEVRSHLRSRRLRDLVYLNADPPAPGPEEKDDGARSWLEQQIGHLPRDRREVLILACLEGLSLEQVAEALRLRPGAVKSLLQQARLELARRLARRRSCEVSP